MFIMIFFWIALIVAIFYFFKGLGVLGAIEARKETLRFLFWTFSKEDMPEVRSIKKNSSKRKRKWDREKPKMERGLLCFTDI